MLYEESDVCARLRIVVWRTANHPGEIEDFFQEGTIHLWSVENATPGQSVSWYMQSCSHYLADLARQGRSVDAAKRAHLLLSIEQENVTSELMLQIGQALTAKENTFLEASAEDCLNKLSRRLDVLDQKILELRIEGWGLRAVGRILGMSHAAIKRRLLKIRSAARSLGIRPRNR